MDRATVRDVPPRPLHPDIERRLRRIVDRRDRTRARAAERFGADLRELIEAGASVAAIARALDVSRETVYQWTRAGQQVSPDQYAGLVERDERP